MISTSPGLCRRNSVGSDGDKGGQSRFAGTARRVLRTKRDCPLLPRGRPGQRQREDAQQSGGDKQLDNLHAIGHQRIDQQIAQQGARHRAQEAGGAQHADQFGQAAVRSAGRDERHRGPVNARHGAAIGDAQQIDGRPGVAGHRQMGETSDAEQKQRAEPERPGAVAVDPRSQGHSHEEAADHADADDPAEVKLGAAQQRDEVGVAEQQGDARQQKRIRQIRQPERPAVGNARLGRPRRDGRM